MTDSMEIKNLDETPIHDSMTEDEVTPSNSYPEPRRVTLADDLRSAVVSKMLNMLSETNGDLPLLAVHETAGRSILLEFNDDSRLLIQAAAITPGADINFVLPDSETTEAESTGA